MLFEQKTFVVWGAQQYAKSMIDDVLSFIKIKYVIPDGNSILSNVELLKFDELVKLKNPFVLIARAPEMSEEIEKISLKLDVAGIEFDHISHYVRGAVFKVSLLKSMDKYNYIHYNGNKISITKTTSDNIQIKFLRNARNCQVILSEGLYVRGIINIEFFGSDSKLFVGRNSNFINVKMEVGYKQYIHIGEDCLFSFGILFGGTDQHPIFDLETKKRINHCKDVKIGNHVWVGRDVRILSGAMIGDGSIVGTGTITSSTFSNNVIIAGVPAKVVRENILWAKDTLASDPIDMIDDCSDQSSLKWI